MNIMKRIVVHTFLEIDGIEHTDFVTVIRKKLSALDDKAAFRKHFVKIKMGENLAFFVLFSIHISNSCQYKHEESPKGTVFGIPSGVFNCNFFFRILSSIFNLTIKYLT